MENSKILSYVDHTLLKPTATWDEIKSLCEEAIEYKTASVCVPPSYVKAINQDYGSKLCICTVIGFPLGYNTTEIKVLELQKALADGASEFDMVINQCDVKNGNFEKVEAEIYLLKKEVKGKILKVIIETCNLNREEKISLCKCVTQAGADYIKTSTGFGLAGAKMEDILLFKEYIGNNVKIKAAGGIKTKQDMIDYIEAGCMRLGTSAAVKIISGEATSAY